MVYYLFMATEQVTTAATLYLAAYVTNDEYTALLAQCVKADHGANSTILDVPGVYEALATHYEFAMMAAHIAAKTLMG